MLYLPILQVCLVQSNIPASAKVRKTFILSPPLVCPPWIMSLWLKQRRRTVHFLLLWKGSVQVTVQHPQKTMHLSGVLSPDPAWHQKELVLQLFQTSLLRLFASCWLQLSSDPISFLFLFLEGSFIWIVSMISWLINDLRLTCCKVQYNIQSLVMVIPCFVECIWRC